MVALTCNDTLSLVMTACWSPVMGNSRMSTFSILSTKGRSTHNPGWLTPLNSPKRFTTPTLPCWTILTQRDKSQAASPMLPTTTITRMLIRSPVDANTCTPHSHCVEFFRSNCASCVCCVLVRLPRHEARGQPILARDLADLVTSLHNHSPELCQAEQGEQVHKIVEDEHL